MKTNIFTAIQWKEIKRKVAKIKGKKVDVKGYRRLLALHMRGLGNSRAQIKEVLGFSEQYITDLVAKYKKHGMDSVLSLSRINIAQIIARRKPTAL